MPDHAELTRRLADLVVGFGANVQPGQLVALTSFIGKEELTREIARAAYEHGASFVDTIYMDQWLKRERLLHADRDTLSYIPPWMIDPLRELSNERAARLSLTGPEAPHALDGVPADRFGIDLLPFLPEVGPVVSSRTTNWCATPAPPVGWATLVFPDAEPSRAYDRLWEAVAHVCRLDEHDPVATWRERMRTLKGAGGARAARGWAGVPPSGPGTHLTL